ncbi:MAG: ABC transporter permease [Thermotogota bacterium]|nr:ABC transporter permease [Thermotogota bacterium]
MIKNILNLIVNEIKIIFRARGVFILILLIPLVLTFISAGVTQVTDITTLRLGIINEDKTFIGLFFLKYATSMLKGDNIIELSSREEINDHLDDLDGVFVIPKGFANNLLFQKPSELIFIPNPHSLQTTIAIYQVMTNVLREFKALPVVADPDFMENMDVDPNYVAPKIAVDGIEEEKLGFSSFLFPSLLTLTLLFISIIGITWTIQEDRRSEMIDLLKIANVSRSQFMISKFISYFFIGILELGVFLLTGKITGFLKFSFSVYDILLFMVLIFLFTALGSFFASISKTVRGAQFLSTGFSIVLVILSGVLFPISAFPGWLKTLCNSLPMNQLINKLQGTILFDYSWADVQSVIGTNLIIGLVLLAFSIIILKFEGSFAGEY